jgi:hypothetical protein
MPEHVPVTLISPRKTFLPYGPIHYPRRTQSSTDAFGELNIRGEFMLLPQILAKLDISAGDIT